jgi:hypothetical protein
VARRPLKHEMAAMDRARENVRQMGQDAMDRSRARGNPGLAMYGREGPKGGPERPSVRSEQATLTPTDVQKIEHALGGAKAHAVLAALKQAGLVAGGPRSGPAQQDRGTMSPLGGRAV